MPQDQEVINRWSAAAPYWEKHRDVIREMFAPVTDALIEEGRIERGHTVLDIASGAGEPAFSVAAVVGPGGKVVGIDPVPDMVAGASRAAERLGIGNAQFEVAFADHLPFADDTFDAVICRFGAMFFPAPADALREMLRVLKPGGKLAMAVWHSAETNPFFHTVSGVLEKYDDAPPADPDAPQAFRFASHGKLREILGGAGAANTAERLLKFPIHAAVSVEDFWAMRSEISESMRAKLRALSAEQVAQVKGQALDVLRAYATDRGMSFPAEVLIVSGSKKRIAGRGRQTLE